jgi:hypothetical protein
MSESASRNRGRSTNASQRTVHLGPLKRKPKKLTDAERHARFKELGRGLGAEGEAPNFDRTVKGFAELPREEAEKKQDG